jgi:hypothetical protein
MIYLADAFGPQYRGTAFLNNIHGNRINNDLLERRGSGYIARHRPDFMLSADKWYRGITLHYGPDGAIYTSDWSDTDECHDHEAERGNGRIYRIAPKNHQPVRVDLAKLSDLELVELQTHSNEWYVRQSRRILAHRPASEATDAAIDDLAMSKEFIHQLRAIWLQHARGRLSEAHLISRLGSRDEHMRAWAVRLICEDRNPSDDAIREMGPLAQRDPSALVRLHLASSAQRIPLSKRWAIMEPLIAHAEDAFDPNLPLMYWYAIEPLVLTDKARALRLAGQTKIPKLREFITRRLAS